MFGSFIHMFRCHFVCMYPFRHACEIEKGNELIMQNNLLEEEQRSQTPQPFWIQQCLLKFVRKFQGGKNVPPLPTTLVMHYVVFPMSWMIKRNNLSLGRFWTKIMSNLGDNQLIHIMKITRFTWQNKCCSTMDSSNTYWFEYLDLPHFQKYF